MRRTLPRLTALIAAAAVTVAAVTAIPANGAITPAFYEPNPNNWLYFGWENDHPKSVSTMGGTVYPGRGDAVRYTLSVNETEYTPDERSASRRQNTTWYQADGYMNSPVSEWNAGDTGVRIKIQHVANRVLNDLATVVFTQVTVTNSRNVPAEVALNVGAGVTVEVPLGGRQPDVQTNTYTVYELDVPANGEVSLDFAARANGEATSIQLTGLGDFASNYAAVKAYYDELISGIAHPVSLPDEEIRNSYLNAAIVTQQTQVATQHVNRDWVAPQWNGITAGEVGYSNAAPVPLTVSANRYAEVSASRTAGETGGAPTIKTDVIESVRNDTWVYMPGVDFGEPKNKVVLRASIPAAAAGGTGDIYFGSMDGSPVATFALLDKTPGTWDEMGTFVRDISPLSGVHDVYIKFRGQSGPAFFNLRAMTFLGQGESVTVGAREVTQVGNGVRASAYGDSVENITDGDWLRYGSLQVTGNVTGIGVVAACPGTEPCGSVEFMVGSLDSSPVATLPINPTAGWADYQVTGTQLGTPLPPGIYDLYVRAQAPTGVADDVPLFNLSALQFYLDGSDPNPGHYGSASGVDLTGANAITLSVDAETHNAVYELQVRTGSYDGPLIASLTIDDSNKGLDLAAALSGVSGVQSLWFSWTVEDEGQYYTDYEARTSGGNKATIGSNYDRLHTHDHPNKVDQIIREGNIELGKRILGSPYYLALPVELYSNFLDAPPKFIVPFATMWQVLDNAGRAEFFTPAVKSRVKAAAKKVSDYMTGPLGLMEKSNTLDNGNDYLLVDNFAVLLGYTAYAYLAENWGWSDEAAWATERMETVNTALNSQLDAWEDQVGAPWYMACLEQTCSFWGRHVQRNPAYDGNWLASSLMTATFPWDAVMKGFDLGGTWSDNFDASIERMAELRDESPIIPEGSWGAWWGHYYGSAYNVGQNIPLLYSEKHREMVIRSYEWLMKAQTAPLQWGESFDMGLTPDDWTRPAADYEGWALGFLREGLLQATASVNVDGDVIVGRGIPEDWMSVSKAPIEWKNIAINDGRHLDSLRLNATDARTIELTLTGDNASGDITLNLPLLKENIEGASAGVVDNAKGTVTVPGNTKSLTVTLQRDIREFSTLERPTVTSLAGTGSGGLSLTWDPVQGAEHYVVTVTAGGESSEYVVANGASFTLPAVIPTLSYSLVVKAVGSGLESENSVTSSITLPLPEATTGGELSITTSNPAVGAANPVNLTALGTTDWIKTGLEPRILENYPYLNRKSGVEPAIQRYLVNENPGDLLMQINAQMYFEWTDGVEPQTGSGANYSTQFGSAHGRAFEQSTRSWIMTAPGGDPEGNVLTIYTGAWQASQRIDVYLSDNSAPFQTYEFTVAAPDENKKIDIEYTVPPGVEVIVVGTVTGKTNNSGNIWIPAATLTGDVIPPPVSVPDEADKSTLGALAEEIQALDEAAYSPNSWAVLNAALEHAEGVLADGDASQEEVDRAAVRLVVALVGLIPTRAEAPVSTGALGGIVAVIQARALAESNYTPSSWGPFAAALAAAQAFLKADADPTQMQIDSALAILVGAFAGLTAVPPAVIVDKSVLTSLISQIPSLDEELYSPPSWVAVASALEAAIGVAADPDATQVAVDAATARLTIALAGLIPTQQEPGLAGARAVLARLITDAALLDSSAYTPATWAAFAAALSSAIEAVAVGESVEELYSATSALGSAIARLAFREVEPPEEPEVPAIHADGLDRVAEAASVLTKAAYTETSWALVAEALAHARRVLAEPSPSQGRIDAAAEWLTSAITLLVAQDPRRDQAPGDTPADAPADRDGDGDGTGPGAGVDTRTAAPDTTAMQALLKGLIGDSALFDPAKYTADSWQAHAQALAAAKMVSVNPSATPSEIGAAFAALTKAMIALAPAPETTVRDTPIPAPTAIKVKTAQTAVALVKGKSVTVAAGAYTSTGTKVGATWTSSNMKVATVTASGKITAKKAGKATISVTAAGGKKATIRVTVLKAKAAKSKVAKVALSGAPRTMAVGQVSWIGAKYAPARATSVRVAYASSNPGVAAIDKAGRLVAKAPGKAVLTVKAGGKTAKTTVTVSAAP